MVLAGELMMTAVPDIVLETMALVAKFAHGEEGHAKL